MTTDTGGPAFPSTLQYFPDDTSYHDSEGMTLRDYFAAKAMQALLVDKPAMSLHGAGLTDVAMMAYRQANAMLAERNK